MASEPQSGKWENKLFCPLLDKSTHPFCTSAGDVSAAVSVGGDSGGSDAGEGPKNATSNETVHNHTAMGNHTTHPAVSSNHTTVHHHSGGKLFSTGTVVTVGGDGSETSGHVNATSSHHTVHSASIHRKRFDWYSRPLKNKHETTSGWAKLVKLDQVGLLGDPCAEWVLAELALMQCGALLP